MRWFPWEVLQIGDIATCVGYAHSQGRRCSNPLSSTKKDAAEMLLSNISYYPISCEELIFDCLEVLASYLLCPHRHEDQAQSLVETWKRRLLRLQRAKAMQEIQNLERSVENLTARLVASSLNVPQHHLPHGPAVNRVLDEDRPVRSGERNAAHFNATASSSRQRFTTAYTDSFAPSNMRFDDDGILPSRGHYPDFREGASSSQLTPSPAMNAHAQVGKDQNKALKEAKADCPICFEGHESMDDVARCHGCLEKFHESCIKAWLKQCKETSVNATCPCCRLDWDE